MAHPDHRITIYRTSSGAQPDVLSKESFWSTGFNTLSKMVHLEPPKDTKFYIEIEIPILKLHQHLEKFLPDHATGKYMKVSYRIHCKMYRHYIDVNSGLKIQNPFDNKITWEQCFQEIQQRYDLDRKAAELKAQYRNLGKLSPGGQ